MNCPVETRPGCARVDVRLLEGTNKGRESWLVLPGDDAAPRLSPGDRIRVVASQGYGADLPLEALEVDPTQAPYSFVDTSGARRCCGWHLGSSRSSRCSAGASAFSHCSAWAWG